MPSPRRRVPGRPRHLRGRRGRGLDDADEDLLKSRRAKGEEEEEGEEGRRHPVTLSVGSQQQPVNQTAGEGKEEEGEELELQGGRDMPTRPNRCEDCPDPPSNKLPIREHDLYMLDSPIIVAVRFYAPTALR